MIFNLGKRSLRIGFSARHAWNDFKVFKSWNYLHIVWGRFAMLYQWDYDCSYCEDAQDDCKECCPHDEMEHYICSDCGYEKCPGEDIDAAEYTYGDR